MYVKINAEIRVFESAMSSINKLIDAQQKHTYAACVELARDLFQENFHDSMAQLLHSFPPDLITNSGRRFWK